MTVYANSDYYARTYLNGRAAVISSEPFPFYARKASSYIDQYTFGNIGEDIPDAVRLCCCELAEVLFTLENGRAAQQGISSEKVGDWTVSYESGTERQKLLPQRVKAVVYAWLADTGLLHRGGRLKC